jgi:hypothetical protein
MLAASSFDDILAITLFSVFSSIAIDTTLAKYPDPKKNKILTTKTTRRLEGADDGTSVKTMIGMNVFYVVIGFCCAVAIGNSMGCFNACNYPAKNEIELEHMPEAEKAKELEDLHKSESTWKLVKFFVMLSVAVGTPLVSNAIHFEESKFIMIIFFGYFCY